MKTLCMVDVSAVLSHLTGLSWPGVGNMIAAAQFPVALALDVGALCGQVLASLPGRRRGICYLARRVPGEHVPPHTDGEDDDCTLRVHVPLQTSPQAEMLIDGVWMPMPVGFAYTFDPTREHAVRNNGMTDRIHLFFNAVLIEERDGVQR